MSPDAVAPARLTDPASGGWFEQEEASRAKSVVESDLRTRDNREKPIDLDASTSVGFPGGYEDGWGDMSWMKGDVPGSIEPGHSPSSFSPSQEEPWSSTPFHFWGPDFLEFGQLPDGPFPLDPRSPSLLSTTTTTSLNDQPGLQPETFLLPAVTPGEDLGADEAFLKSLLEVSLPGEVALSYATSRTPHPPSLSLATFETDESRWAAVVARSPEADGHFYFCVSSTSIFCRPSCPSRRPDRRNVVFVTTIPAAHAAGYRACKRCTPEDDVGLAEQRQLEAVEKVKAIIGGCVGRGERVPGLDTLAGEVRMSKFHLQRVFKKREGISPKQYASACGGRSIGS